MPVSRKRKKSKSKSNSPSRAASQRGRTVAGSQSDGEFAAALNRIAGSRRKLDKHRASLAAAAAEALVAELVSVAASRSGSDLEDALCARLGASLAQFDEGPLDDRVGPDLLLRAVIEAAAALSAAEGGGAGALGAGRVLLAAAQIAPEPLREFAADTVAELSQVADEPIAPELRGEVLWTRDAYGSRFAITAPFSTPDGADRWYLWDVDTCGYKTATVRSGYYATSADALEAWQDVVGEVAAGQNTFAPVGDRSLLIELLPAAEGFLRVGGESAGQYAEYHRSRRLAEAVIEAVPDSPPSDEVALDRTAAASQFVAWLRDSRADRPQPAELDELAAELADSWCLETPLALYTTCSPHRVALTVLHLRDYYQDEYAEKLVELLPDWTSWLAGLNGTAAHLADRCRPYAAGEPHLGLVGDEAGVNHLVPVAE